MSILKLLMAYTVEIKLIHVLLSLLKKNGAAMNISRPMKIAVNITIYM